MPSSTTALGAKLKMTKNKGKKKVRDPQGEPNSHYHGTRNSHRTDKSEDIIGQYTIYATPRTTCQKSIVTKNVIIFLLLLLLL
jgi:hypothetical protein